MYTWKRHFVVQADYQHWANEALFSALAHLKPEVLEADQGVFCRSIHHTLDHMLVVGQLWRARLQGVEHRANPREIQHPVWRELLAAIRHETRRLEEWLQALPEDFFEKEVDFTDSDGRARTLWVRDVLNHINTHYAYQRGQLVAMATRLGAPSPEMGYEHYRREMEKLLEAARRAPN